MNDFKSFSEGRGEGKVERGDCRVGQSPPRNDGAKTEGIAAGAERLRNDGVSGAEPLSPLRGTFPFAQGESEGEVNIAEAIAKAFSGKSEGQIWQAVLEQAERGKREGTLTDADLDNFYNAVAPLVDGFKRQKLKKIISRLKQI